MLEVNRQRLALAEVLGEPPESILATNPRWLQLLQEGVLVSLHIGRWRARTRLAWQDLGIEIDARSAVEVQKVIDLGHKKLLPDDLLRGLDAVESSARKWLERKSYRTYWGYFVPVTAYPEWKATNAEHRERYFALRDRIVGNYDSIVDEVLESYRVAAAGAYQRLAALDARAATCFPGVQEFVDAFVGRMRGHLLSADEIAASFYYRTELRYVPLPGLMAEERAQAERAELEARLAQDRYWAECEQLAAEVSSARTAAEWKERQLQAMNRDVLAQAQRQKEELVDGFLRDVVVQLRALVYAATTDVLAAIEKNAALPPRSVAQLNNLIKQVQALNFYGDEDVAAMVNRLGFSVGQAAATRNVPGLQESLRDVATVVRASLLSLGDQPRGARMLGVADEPTPDMVRRARRNLGLEGDAEPPPGADRGLPPAQALLPFFRQARLADAFVVA